ncbi:putative copper-binding protein [Streptomyces himastatinicus ATCC 53653]|uniref:Putative copper-binding protein n=1 Tax=Streptomyces himastatinicus ATCC 53653 TaxID=457427 RepID=D9WFZ1_9ACTN|nr:putative copper-binding protein [Streptomyces himastatinicus ATCC 53653]
MDVISRARATEQKAHREEDTIIVNSINRRSVLLTGLGIAGAGALAACGGSDGEAGGATALVKPSDPAVAAAEKKRTSTGTVHKLTLTAAPAMLELGDGVMAKSWAFGGQAPGKEVRVSAGDTVAAELSNQLPNRTATSIHWHGLALRNDMDGVPPATQTAVRAGAGFTYRFIAETPGTYFFHPHVGVQLDRGLHAPLIVEDPKEPLSYDDEWVVVLDDWVDGVTGTPDEVFAELKRGMGGMDMGGHDMGGHDMGDMGGMDHEGEAQGAGKSASPSKSASGDGMSMKFMLMGAESDLLGGDAGDVKYPYHLVNGPCPGPTRTCTPASPGKRVRLRIINAAATRLRVALGGTDDITTRRSRRARRVDVLLIGMGERYDVLVTLADGGVAARRTRRGEERQWHGPGPYRLRQGPERHRPPEGTERRDRDGLPASRGGRRPAAVEEGRPGAPHRPDRRYDEVQLGHQRQALRHERSDGRPPRDRGRAAGPARFHEPHGHVAPDASARPHVPARELRTPQGHSDRAAEEEAVRDLRRRQPRPVDAALPQRLPRGGGDDGAGGLSGLMAPEAPVTVDATM